MTSHSNSTHSSVRSIPIPRAKAGSTRRGLGSGKRGLRRPAPGDAQPQQPDRPERSERQLQQPELSERTLQQHQEHQETKEESIDKEKAKINSSSSHSGQVGAYSAKIERRQVQVAPGTNAPFRGSDETTEAMRKDFITHLACWGCTQEVYCIADCRWAICPDCQTISPLDNCADDAWGLGLGLAEDFVNASKPPPPPTPTVTKQSATKLSPEIMALGLTEEELRLNGLI